MKMIKNLSKANIKNYEGFERREDLDFSDDGNYFRGFSYKGMPITTLRSGDTTYLSIRVDYLNYEDGIKFTYKDWMKTEERHLEDEFNGVYEFDMDKLIENLEKIIAKVNEMNEAAEAEVIDTTAIVDALFDEIMMAEKIINDFKANCKWYEIDGYKLKNLVSYMKSAEAEVARANAIKVNELTKKQQKEMIQRLNEYGFVVIRKDGFYLTELVEATK